MQSSNGNAVQAANGCSMWPSYKTHKDTVWTRSEQFWYRTTRGVHYKFSSTILLSYADFTTSVHSRRREISVYRTTKPALGNATVCVHTAVFVCYCNKCFPIGTLGHAHFFPQHKYDGVPSAYLPTHASYIPPVSRAQKLSTEMQFAPKYQTYEATRIWDNK